MFLPMPPIAKVPLQDCLPILNINMKLDVSIITDVENVYML